MIKGVQTPQLDELPLTTKPLIPSLVSKLILIGLTFLSTYLSITQVIPFISKTSSLSFNSSRVRRKEAVHAHPPPPNCSFIRMTEVGFCLMTSISFSWASGVTCSITAHPFPLGKSWGAAAFFDTGWPGVTPYLRFLALPHQQPPKVTANSMLCKNLVTLFPLRADTQIGHPISQ